MNRSKNRARLRRIEVLLEKHPEGLRQSEIARELKLHRSTVMQKAQAQGATRPRLRASLTLSSAIRVGGSSPMYSVIRFLWRVRN
jgi:DNA-binding transcriptional regulator LsrR (DeoR family)